MSSFYGENIKLNIFGQSHSLAVGMTLDGLPAGLVIDFKRLQAFLDRRAPGRNGLSTPRKEADVPEFVSGLVGDKTCGAPLTAVIRNRDCRPEDYDSIKITPRPGHADYTGWVKYGGFQDFRGGGHFSGRLTAPLCVAGGICLQFLENEGIKIVSRIVSIGDITDSGELNEAVADGVFPVVSREAGEKMREAVEASRADGDSLGGVIECAVTGLPPGLGDPIFDGMENRISRAVFGIPAVKGIEFGAGFAAAAMKGSENNDFFCFEDGRVVTETNNCGGILGGITNGMPLVFRVAVKPTPSIGLPQRTVDLEGGGGTEIIVKGRHDSCIVPRAVPCVEAAAAIACFDALLGRRREII